MDTSHYFLGNEILVVTVEHGEMDRRSHVDSAANRHAMELVRNLLPSDTKASVSLRNYEKKTAAESGDPVSIYTYDLAFQSKVIAPKH